MHSEEGEDGFRNVLGIFLGVLSTYGWILIGGVTAYFLFWDKIVNYWHSLSQSEESQNHSGQGMKNEEALQEARRKMQEHYDKLAKEHSEQMKEIEADKRRQRIAEFEEKASHGHRLGTGDKSTPSSVTKSSRIREDNYSPLSGAGGVGGFRSARSCGPRGG